MPETNALKIIKQLDQIVSNDIPFAQSRAMQNTVVKAANKAQETLRDAVQRNAEGANDNTDDLAKSLRAEGPGKGAVRARWPSKKVIQSGKPYEALVYVVNDTRNRGRSFDLIEELHPLVFGGKVSNVPERANTVITPTTALLKGLKGQGRLKQLGDIGEIKSLKSGILKRLKNDKERYLNVPINNADPKLNHLPAGLYFRGRERSKGGLLKVGWRYESGKLSRSKGKQPRQLVRYRGVIGPRGRAKRKQGRIVGYLVMLLAYHKQREYDAIWDFPGDVVKVYKDCYADELSKQVVNAIIDSQKRFIG